jgi:Raf kinase inhibitor-like YbhB/YbcL family protein
MAFGGCNAETPEAMAGAAAGETKREASIMKLTSPAFGDGGTIPARYTCDGGDVIPPLVFTNVPHEAKTLALVVDDPDAPVGTWDHWVVWNIPATTAGVEEGKPPTGVVGRNSWKKNSWGGPCPPDREHRYFFRLYALDATLDLARDATKAELERAMDDHLLAETELMARYERRRR